MITIMQFELQRIQVQVLQIPKILRFLGIVVNIQNIPMLTVLAQNDDPVEDTVIHTFSVGEDIGELFPYIRGKDCIGTYLSTNRQTTRVVFA